MDDFNIVNLRESRNEWTMRLINILTPKISEGMMSIFVSARKLCMDNNEPEKYLLTFQNLLTRIPQWNPEIIKEETNRILTTSNCKYLEDLIMCVHIIQLKILTYVRVGTKNKKIDLNIPKLNEFIHKIYILIARVVYQKAYLYSLEINSLDRQKNNSILESIIQECIMNAIRDSIPCELIVRSYLDETDEICEEIKEEIIKEKLSASAISNKKIDNTNKTYKSTSSLPEISKIPDTVATPENKIVNDIHINTILPELLIPSSSNSVDVLNNSITPLTDIFTDNILLDNLTPATPASSPTTITFKDNALVDDLDLMVCDLPTNLNDVAPTPSLDFIELN